VNARRFAAFVCGLVFAAGLGLSGMTQPSKVLAFLDVAGDWDPSLALVMGGALGVAFLAFPRILRRPRPVLDVKHHLAPKHPVDARLVVGAVLFGVGWGLGGYCPGPAIVSLATGARPALAFVVSMAAGMVLFRLTLGRGADREAEDAPSAAPAAAPAKGVEIGAG
jgi:hypothetical protein